MYCKNCGNKIIEDVKFCGGCGKKTTGEISSDIEKNINNDSNNSVEVEKEIIIKCGNCEYIGKGQKARSTWAIVLAWLCVVFAPMVTIIYYLATSKYKCPKCGSTFLGVKNEEGKFVGQKGSAGGRVVLILVCILFVIAFIGILSSVVLASLSSAREKGKDAAVKSQLVNMKVRAELYWNSESTDGKDGSYYGLCDHFSTSDIINPIPDIDDKSEATICKDNKEGYAISSQLNSGGYWCVDSSGFSGEISSIINSATCSSFSSINNDTVNNPILSGAEICARGIPNSTWDGKTYTEDGSYQCSCKKGYDVSRISGNCVSQNQICNETYLNTRDIGNNTCDCKPGYTWNSKQTACN